MKELQSKKGQNGNLGAPGPHQKLQKQHSVAPLIGGGQPASLLAETI
jgi:hypothetical protein